MNQPSPHDESPGPGEPCPRAMTPVLHVIRRGCQLASLDQIIPLVSASGTVVVVVGPGPQVYRNCVSVARPQGIMTRRVMCPLLSQ